MVPPQALVRWLRCATLVFLALPLAIFFAGWLRGPLALALCATLAAAVWRDRARANPRDDELMSADAGLSWRALAFALVLPAAVLTALSGAGGWGAGDSDWLKHDTILRDLLRHPWPVTYETGHGPVLLVYYVTYYLPAAALGKLAGGSWLVASQTLAATTFLGIILAGGWIVAFTSCRSGRRQSGRQISATRNIIVSAGVFFGFSGLDVLGKLVVNLYLRLPPWYGDWSDVAWWAQFAQYSSNAAAVFWAPQHALGGWLTAALALDDWFRGRGLERRGLLYLALALAWSPFTALGLLPLLAGMTGWQWVHAHADRIASPGQPSVWGTSGWLAIVRSCWRRPLTLANGAGLLAGAIFALYLAAHFQIYSLPAQYRVAPGFAPVPLLTVVPRAALYSVFVVLEFAGFSVALALFYGLRSARNATIPAVEPPAGTLGQTDGRETRKERPLLWVATAVLFALPWFRYGYANDLVMRGAIPALYLLQVLVARMFAQVDSRSPRRQRLGAALAAILFIGGLGNTFVEYRRHVVRLVAQKSWRDARTRQPVRTLAELQRTIYARPGFDFARQYLGSVDSPFVRYCAAPRGALSLRALPDRPSDF